MFSWSFDGDRQQWKIEIGQGTSRDQTGRKQAKEEPGESSNEKHSSGEVEIYSFFRFSLYLLQNGLCDSDISKPHIKLNFWKIWFLNQFPIFQSKKGGEASHFISRILKYWIVRVSMGEERWRLPAETLDLIFQQLAQTDLKSAVQVTDNNFCCCYFHANLLGGLFFHEYCSLIFNRGILSLALLRGSICVTAIFTMIKMSGGTPEVRFNKNLNLT